VASTDLTGAVLDERYRVIEAVAEGAMGVVYRAERLKLGKIVAIKILHDELPSELSSRKRFELEATAMAKLEHPNCAAVLDVGTHEGRAFVVMDFITGEDLKALVDHGPVPVARAVDLVRQVLSGIAHAHELGIIHRDIKPANLILSQKTGLGDHVKILDFGLARLQDETSKLTTGIVVGTPAYMAPEQIRGTAIDTRADLYACGVVLFELLTGQKPFHSEADDPMQVVQMHLKQPPPRLADKLPGVDFGELEAVVAKALAKAADDRFQTAAEFAAALEGAGRRSSPAHAPTEPAGATITDSQAQQISESMMIPSGDTRLGLAVAHAPAPVAPPAPVPAPAPPRLSRKQLQIGGGVLGVVLLIGFIAKCSAGGDAPKHTAAPAGTGSTEIEMQGTEAGGAQKILARADELLARGDEDGALSLLDKSAPAFPDNATIPYRAGKLYFAKLWWTDGLRQLRNAVRIDPTLKTDPELIKTVLKGFIVTPDYNAEIADFLHDDVGPTAAQYLDETARDHPSKSIRARAARELQRYH
jgi:serine/threonine-protein kinase